MKRSGEQNFLRLGHIPEGKLFMLKLHRPDVKYIESYLDFVNEMAKNGEKVWYTFLPIDSESNEQFIERLIRAETSALPGLVTESTYWGIVNEKVVGRISMRHNLTDALKEYGGHIGYEVRPSERRKGYATEMLKQILQTSRAKEIREILLTCDPANTASIKTILANDGILSHTAFVEKIKRNTSYYWIRCLS